MPEIEDVVRTVLADTPRMTDESFTAARERVLNGRKKKRHRGRLAAAVAVVITTAVTVLLLPSNSEPVSAATVLNRAADQIQANDVQLAPGQFRYVRTESTMVSSTAKCQYRERNIDELWIPKDPRAEWLRRRDYGTIEWLTCQDPHSSTLPPKIKKDDHTKHGTFEQETEPSWYNLTPEFLAGLPRDPKALYDLFVREYKSGTRNPSKAYFQLATHVLRSGALPADLRATMYRAMTHIQGVTITEQLATVDGRTGTAIGLDMAGIREDIVIDPANGTLIGSRSVQPDGGLAGATVLKYGVANEIGGQPVT